MKLLMRPSTGHRNKDYILTIFSLCEKFLSIKLVLRECEVFQQTGARISTFCLIFTDAGVEILSGKLLQCVLINWLESRFTRWHGYTRFDHREIVIKQ